MTIFVEDTDAPRTTETPYVLTELDQFIGSVSDEDQYDLIQTNLTAGYGYIARVETTSETNRISVQFRDEAGDYASWYSNYNGHTAIQSIADEATYLRLHHSGRSDPVTEYSVSFFQEISNTIETATSMPNVGTLDSAINYRGDGDWIRIELTSGHGYVFDVQTTDVDASTSVILRDSLGASVLSAQDWDYNPNGSARLGYTPLEDEVVFLSVYGRLNWTGDYTVSVHQEAVGSTREPDDLQAEANLTQLSLGLDVPLIEGFDFYWDTDFFRVDLVQNASYRFNALYPELEGGGYSSQLWLFDASGAEVAEEIVHDFDLRERSLDFTAQESGTYFLQVYNSAAPHAYPEIMDQLYSVSLELASVNGTDADERLVGSILGDTLGGGGGSDTLIGDAGDDVLSGGENEHDLRDVIYGGDGNDDIDGGYGNDELRGDAGNDTIAGGFGADTVIGGTGNDTLTGSAFADQMFGSDGDDFVNGGFGHDLLNGGAGADRFYHIGIADHGSDWVQDYDAAAGDILQFGIASATRSQFQINTTHTSTTAGERSGDDATEEAFVIYRPTGQIMWALVDGAGQSSINLQIGGEVFDLLA
ncbi:calcium-binding protein [Shimia thalassica]|uniref:calcium-binding protein n=1 Tax=Shimia thalassica TaxID=1715693 RepID=UPI0026E26C03|nr:calcium-binding protein [Shimia thalassica]MDO6482678.1 calcium-binding protein [Shimia thalassica]MDO6797441.1 calcium-binding protein [Shimia thalassica]